MDGTVIASHAQTHTHTPTTYEQLSGQHSGQLRTLSYPTFQHRHSHNEASR